jgi:Tetratricopeptide repeat
MNEPPGGAPATRTMPRDIGSFTGRAHELDRLAPAAAAAGGVIGIYAIDGRAGIGTTAFAVHAAHQLAGCFPDGQVFLPLHGHAGGHRPVDPADALARLLLADGVDARQIPAGPQARTRLWRDRLADRRMLLVLDDAAGNEQVGPLQALEIFRIAGHRAGQCAALNELGVAQTLAGEYADAAGNLQEALHAARGAGRRSAEAEVFNNLGTLRLRSGAPGEALACHRRALDAAAR